MRLLSKISTVLAAAGLVACSQSSNDLVIAPGADGTYVAIGADVSGAVTAGNSSFSFSHGRDLSIGVATGGPYPVAESESKLFMPASITKLVTTSLALQELGESFTFSTRVTWSEGTTPEAARNLVIVADGDPQVVRSVTGDGVAQQTVFESIATQLRARGVSRLEGSLQLVSVDERHDLAIPAVGMEDSDHTTCFGAISQSFNFNWNCASLSVASSAVAAWTDSALRFPFDSHVLVGRGQSRVVPLMDSDGRVAKFALEGVAGSKGATFTLPISDVKPWYGRALFSYLTEKGIDTSQATLSLPQSPRAAEILAHLPSPSADRTSRSFTVVSEPLSALIEYTNKPSDNFLADDIFKTIASHHGSDPDLRSEGQAAVRAAISEWMAAAGRPDYTSEVQLLDGAGLSHENRVSARAYLVLLKQFTRQKWFPTLWNSLPIAGQDGTLKPRMLGSDVVGKVRAKTGTLRGSYQLAGYVPRYRTDGSISEYVPFVILSAVDPEKRFDVFNLQTDIASKLFNLVNPGTR